MSRRMQKRLMMLQAVCNTEQGIETAEYASLVRNAHGTTMQNAAGRFLERLQSQYGTVWCPEKAPHATHGYVLYRVDDAGRTEFLCARSPIYGQQIPLAWSSYLAAREHAARLGCQWTQAAHSRCIDGNRYFSDDGIAAFGNKGAAVQVGAIH